MSPDDSYHLGVESNNVLLAMFMYKCLAISMSGVSILSTDDV